MRQAGQALPVHPSLLPACSHEFLLLLPRIVEVEQDNKMTSSNLGIVFGPTLMRPRPTDATISLSSLVDYPHQARIIEALIIFYSTIFENKETTVLADSSKYATDNAKEEAASCSDLVGVSGEGSTLRGCGAYQDSLLALATWSRSAGADPPAALTPPTPLLNGAPASCSALQIAPVTFPIPAVPHDATGLANAVACLLGNPPCFVMSPCASPLHLRVIFCPERTVSVGETGGG